MFFVMFPHFITARRRFYSDYNQGDVVCGYHGGVFRLLLLPSHHQKTDHDNDQLPASLGGHGPEHGNLQRRTGKQ